jgi:hypothetical protein
MNEYFVLTIIFVASFVLRAWPRYILPYGIASDTYFHLYYSKIIRRNNFRIPNTDSRFLLRQEVDYPFFYHWILAFFNDRLRWIAERFISPLFDACASLVVYFICKQLKLDNSISFLVCFIFVVSPALFKNSDEPRVFSGSTRVLAQLLFFVFILGFLLIKNDNQIGYLICLISGAVLFITTKFGIQTYVFFSLLMGIYDYHFWLFVPASFLMSVIISFGRSFRIFKLHFMHSRFLYRSKLFYQALHPKQDLVDFLKGIYQPFYFLFRGEFKLALDSVLNSKSIIIRNFVVFHAYFVLLLPAFINDKFLFIWLLSAIIIFLLTKIPQLRFLGKPERYLEFSLPAALIGMALFLNEFSSVIVLFYLLISLFFSVFYCLEFISSYRKINEDFKSDSIFLSDFYLNNKPGAVWTMHPFMYKPMYFGDFPILSYFAGTINSETQTTEEKQYIMGNYPYPDFNFFEILKRYKVDYLVTEKKYFFHYLNYAKIDYSEVLRYSSNISENDNYIAIKFTVIQ